MKLLGYHFTPGFWPSVAFLILLPLFLSLGFWQLERAAEKRNLLAQFDEKIQLQPRNFDQIDPLVATMVPVRLTGKFITEQFLLDNRVHKGQPGFEVLSAFKLDNDGRVVLVNRGWVAVGRSRDNLPSLDSAGLTAVEVVGLFTRPSSALRLGEAIAKPEADWPLLVNYLDYDAMGAALNQSLIPGVVQLSAPKGPYPRIWQPVAHGPEKHYAYALQWFAIALVLSILYVVLNSRKVKHL
ncbi:MAG TPA: SURF1 family protein [Gammaproteobacteria bacterium]|jgi:surfeit locus 1 family protein|nr:SURF1 family protein [Gammaproteobacteria bacterium]